MCVSFRSVFSIQKEEEEGEGGLKEREWGGSETREKVIECV
jgi:hypothetical protein